MTVNRMSPAAASLSLILVALLAPVAGAYTEAGDAEAGDAAKRRYTFSFPFADGDAMAPRGGTSRGPEPELAAAPTPEWQRLVAMPPGKARDRAAILAMAGDYRVSFDFVEVAGFAPGWTPGRPYQSWATERVLVVEDSEDRIVLQHILEMRFTGEDGTVSEPMVTKHWRQDWRWQPEYTFEYLGDATWQRREVPEAERRRAWAQDVYQVDDSPRYSGVGRWHHDQARSTWSGGDGARPLPRREWSVRSDYGLLFGSNRHTITPDGWIHEQVNDKQVSLAQPRPLAREFGLNRYQRITGGLDATIAYWRATAPMWAQVRARWSALLAGQAPVRLKAEPDQGSLFGPLFAQAQALAEGGPAPDGDQVRALVDAYLAGDASP